jgi:hypothetical protein
VAGHPLNIIKVKIEDYFQSRDAAFERKDSLNPVVTPEQVSQHTRPGLGFQM